MYIISVNVTWMLIRFSAFAAFIPGFVARNWIKIYRKHQRNRDEKIMRFSSRTLLETLYHVLPFFWISFISMFYSNNNIYSLFSCFFTQWFSTHLLYFCAKLKWQWVAKNRFNVPYVCRQGNIVIFATRWKQRERILRSTFHSPFGSHYSFWY